MIGLMIFHGSNEKTGQENNWPSYAQKINKIYILRTLFVFGC